jgi:hypothetical protein
VNPFVRETEAVSVITNSLITSLLTYSIKQGRP